MARSLMFDSKVLCDVENLMAPHGGGCSALINSMMGTFPELSSSPGEKILPILGSKLFPEVARSICHASKQ